MARPIILSNGEMHVGLNAFGMVHDFYFPYVGLENHSAGAKKRHKIGVWIDGQISWLDDGTWDISARTAPNALIGLTRAYNQAFNIILEFSDAVDAEMNVFMRNVHVINQHSEAREVRLFMHQSFNIGDSGSNTDTAQYLPDSEAILHYRGDRAFVMSGKVDGQGYFDQHSIGLFGIEGREGTYRDADDGELSGGNIEHGRVDSTLRFKLHIDGNASTRVHYWMAAGTSIREALVLHKTVDESGVDSRLQATESWWHRWLEPTVKMAEKLPKERRQYFIHSAMVLKAHIDNRGAIIASTDSTMLNYSRDAYGYSWPRDGAYVLWPLMRLGYTEEPLNFFEFCRKGLHPNGYLMHKYRADGALGSSWHPYVHGDDVAPPIQEDETALVLFTFTQFYHMQKDKALLEEYYTDFVKEMANFVAGYVDDATGLPKPTYDLWEENYLTATYTTSLVYASLAEAADIAEIMNDPDSAVKWRAASDDVQRAAHKYLYNKERKAFYKGVRFENGEVVPDPTIDISSFYGSFMFGLFAPQGEEVTNARKTIAEVFDLTEDRPGVERYEGDTYYRKDGTNDSNWWIITTLWLAQYASEIDDNQTAINILDWVEKHAGEGDMFSEQLDPHQEYPVSVSPLNWSHAEYMATLLDMYAGDAE